MSTPDSGERNGHGRGCGLDLDCGNGRRGGQDRDGGGLIKNTSDHNQEESFSNSKRQLRYYR